MSNETTTNEHAPELITAAEVLDLDPDHVAALIDAGAIADHGEADELSEERSNVWGEGSGYSVGSAQWSVLTDDEADNAWDESLDSYLDDCVLPELPETAQQYFDRDAWKRDAKHDGRGHSLNPYDGNEHEYRTPSGEYLYVYQTN